MIEYDPVKSDLNLIRRGFDFDYAARIFEGVVIEQVDDRQDYGETRFIAIGQVDSDILTIVYTWRGDVRRIISARKASRVERNAYENEVS
jgi:uncharacterized DUF497 family protein